jgi:arsenite methyltransferase
VPVRQRHRGPDRPSFGLDAPLIVGAYAALGVVGVVLLVAQVAAGIDLVGLGYWMTPVGLLIAGAMIYSSLRGKVVVRDRLLDRLGLHEDDDVLDLGCGSGLMLLGAATRAPCGTATGIDLWRAVDQAGSSRERCLANATILGVAARVRLIDGDMSELPLADGSVDVVLACLAIHNIHHRAKRARTIHEAARVLRPGGRLGVIDFTRTAEYAAAAIRAGLTDVHRSELRWRMYPPVRILTARKRP